MFCTRNLPPRDLRFLLIIVLLVVVVACVALELTQLNSTMRRLAWSKDEQLQTAVVQAAGEGAVDNSTLVGATLVLDADGKDALGRTYEGECGGVCWDEVYLCFWW